jgi:hypothetical protein
MEPVSGSHARSFWQRKGLRCITIRAPWKSRHGRGAGPVRNGWLAELLYVYRRDGRMCHMHAWPDPSGSGTQDALRQVQREGFAEVWTHGCGATK